MGTGFDPLDDFFLEMGGWTDERIAARMEAQVPHEETFAELAQSLRIAAEDLRLGALAMRRRGHDDAAWELEKARWTNIGDAAKIERTLRGVNVLPPWPEPGFVHAG